MNPPRHLLVFRFSALGDIAMTVPVIRLVLQQHPHLQITYVSAPFAAPLFADIERLHFFAADFKKQYKGVNGLYQLHKHLLTNIHFDAIADLHNVLRTKLLRLFFALSPKKMAVLDKGRAGKKELTRVRNKRLHPLPTMFERYASVFNSFDLAVDLNQALPALNLVVPDSLQAVKLEGYRLVGVAPFAKHAEKTYPLPRMMEVVKLLAAAPRVKVFLFGGKEEAITLDSWAGQLQEVTSLAGKMDFAEELAHIQSLDVMV
ncbi:MAG: glycosyltransferase family 9 protein, partial [Chitinophagaceae bacterium]